MRFDLLCFLAGVLGIAVLLVCYSQLEETLPHQKPIDTSVSGSAFSKQTRTSSPGTLEVS